MTQDKHFIDFTSAPADRYIGENDTVGLNRVSWRVELILSRNRTLIEGKRVLDLACHDGHMSYSCLALGAQSVTGVEAREDQIKEGKARICNMPCASQANFVQGDLFDYLESQEPGTFDVILCLGFLYHTVRQVDYFRQMNRLRPSTIFIDTSVAKNYWWYGRRHFGKPPALFVTGTEDPTKKGRTTDHDGIVMWPSTSFLELMMEKIGYEYRRIEFKKSSINDWSGLNDYRRGTRAVYVATTS